MSKPHKHAELIKAWADGASIQAKLPKIGNGEWYDTDIPTWGLDKEYRLKPESKPDIVLFTYVDGFCERFFANEELTKSDNLKIIFDGETGKLKSAEVL